MIPKIVNLSIVQPNFKKQKPPKLPIHRVPHNHHKKAIGLSSKKRKIQYTFCHEKYPHQIYTDVNGSASHRLFPRPPRHHNAFIRNFKTHVTLRTVEDFNFEELPR
jgi:hypothetical protein